MAGSELEEQIESKQTDYFRDEQRRCSRVASLGWAVVLICTLYYAAVNTIYITSAQIPSYRLTVEHSLQDGTAAEYELFLDWNPLPGISKPVRPILTLDGTRIPELGAGSLPVDLRKQYVVDLDFPLSCTGATHNGSLVLQRVSGSDSLPARSLVPISIEVQSGVWRNWRILGSWLVFAFLSGAVLYGICLVQFPSPSGVIVFDQAPPSLLVRRPVVRLRVLKRNWVFPWRRHLLPLNWLWKRAGVALPVNGQLCFVMKGMSPVLHSYGRGDGSFERRRVRFAGNRAEWRSCGVNTRLSEDFQYAYRYAGQSIVFKYEVR